ncbi:MAG TPA: ACT domain-containing protein [Jatrophihabitans sp.]|jgi:hypothetical protein|nr:ACT domain-containing protein [Jatrophihabitans sp.]
MPERASHRHRPEHRSPAGPRNECDTSVRQAVDVSYLLRLVLPDRPGALGAVATALGTVGADILSVDVIERSPGSATDDFVVELPPDKLADSLVSAAATVPGVQVESIRPYAGQIDPHRELALLDSLGQSPESSLPLLAHGVARVFRAGWALVLGPPVLGHAHVLARGGAAPELDSLPTPWWPPAPTRPLDCTADWAPTDWGQLGTELAVTALGDAALLIGRPALRWLPSELVRLQHLAAIAATVTPVQSDATT